MFTDAPAVQCIGAATKHSGPGEGHPVFVPFAVLHQCTDLRVCCAGECDPGLALNEDSYSAL